MEEKKSASSSMQDDKILAAVSAFPLVGLIVYFAMPNASAFVKNYAKQGMGLFIFVIPMLLAFIPLLGWILSCLGSILMFAGVVVLLIKALQGDEKFRLPVIADLMDNLFK